MMAEAAADRMPPMGGDETGRKESIPEDVAWFLTRSDGFMDLRMPDRARDELHRVPGRYRQSAAYRNQRLRLALRISELIGVPENGNGLALSVMQETLTLADLIRSLLQ